MSDYGDDATKISQTELEQNLIAARLEASNFDSGVEGLCSGCDEYFTRVVLRGSEYFCGACRDRLNKG